VSIRLEYRTPENLARVKQFLHELNTAGLTHLNPRYEAPMAVAEPSAYAKDAWRVFERWLNAVQRATMTDPTTAADDDPRVQQLKERIAQWRQRVRF
jgi:hypothetical protein